MYFSRFGDLVSRASRQICQFCVVFYKYEEKKKGRKNKQRKQKRINDWGATRGLPKRSPILVLIVDTGGKIYLFYFIFIFPRYRPPFGECCVCSLSLFRFEI